MPHFHLLLFDLCTLDFFSSCFFLILLLSSDVGDEKSEGEESCSNGLNYMCF